MRLWRSASAIWHVQVGWGAELQSREGPLEGWRVASKRLGPLPRIRWAALGRGCGRGGPWGAAAAEAGRHLNPREGTPPQRPLPYRRCLGPHAWLGLGSGVGAGLGLGCPNPNPSPNPNPNRNPNPNPSLPPRKIDARNRPTPLHLPYISLYLRCISRPTHLPPRKMDTRKRPLSSGRTPGEG